MSSTLQLDALRTARVLGEMLKREQQKQAALQRKQAEIQAHSAKALDALLSGGRIFEEHKEAVAKALPDHVACLDLLAKVAYHRNEHETPDLGRTYNQKPAVKMAKVCGAPVSDYDETLGGQAFRQILLGR